MNVKITWQATFFMEENLLLIKQAITHYHVLHLFASKTKRVQNRQILAQNSILGRSMTLA